MSLVGTDGQPIAETKPEPIPVVTINGHMLPLRRMNFKKEVGPADLINELRDTADLFLYLFSMLPEESIQKAFKGMGLRLTDVNGQIIYDANPAEPAKPVDTTLNS